MRTGSSPLAPVALIIFNRPDATARVFEQIRHAKPETLFLISDGPRHDVTEDRIRVKMCRDIVGTIDWPCEVRRIYSDSNLGCKNRINSGLTEVFKHVDYSIILEDDCVPHLDFFAFTSELLGRYQRDERIFSVGGHIWEFPDNEASDSYIYSSYFSSWGWATWSDRWAKVDYSMTSWPELKASSFLEDIVLTPMELVFWNKTFDMTYQGVTELSQAWDYAVQLTMWKEAMFSIRPSVNLVKNIGLGPDATHTSTDSPAISAREAEPLVWPLRHPDRVERNVGLDRKVNDARIGGSLRRLLVKHP